MHYKIVECMYIAYKIKTCSSVGELGSDTSKIVLKLGLCCMNTVVDSKN